MDITLTREKPDYAIYVVLRNNFMHVCRFRGFVKSGLRSNYTCAACKGPIKALQKLIKCSREPELIQFVYRSSMQGKSEW